MVFNNILIAFNMKKDRPQQRANGLNFMIFGCYFTAIKRAII